MSLVHQFAVIPKESNEVIVSTNMYSVEIPDYLIQYIDDSLKWIHSEWNGKAIKEGISYYGYSIIENNELGKLEKIIIQWKNLFDTAPRMFELTGEFLPDVGRYKKIVIEKRTVILSLEKWLNICRMALENGDKILHNGI